MRQDVANFTKGCTTCQSTKSRTTQSKPLLYPITTESDALPFETITMDFIMKLPKSEGHDMILTIINQACLKATLFLSCKEQIDAEGVVALYAQKVFPHFSIPQKVISNREHTLRLDSQGSCVGYYRSNKTSAVHTTHRQTDSPNEQINGWNNSCESIPMEHKQTGVTGS